MGWGFRRFVGIAVVLVVSSWAPASYGQANAAAAQVLFEQGRAAMAAKEYDKACERFRASDKIDPQVGTKFNLAECERLRGNLATAWELFRAVSAKLQPSDQRLTVASGRAASLEQRLPHVTLRLAPGAPPNTTVRIGKMQLGVAAFGAPLPLDPGKHNIVAAAPGYEKKVFTVNLKEGEQRTLDVGPKAAADGQTPSSTDEDYPSWIERHTWSTVTGVLALGLAGAGVGVGAAAWSNYDELVVDCAGTVNGCADEDVDAVRTKTIVSNVLLGTAGAAAVTSLVLFFFVEESAPADEPGAEAADGAPEVSLVPVPYYGAGLQLRF